ncbi:MAG: hypothetical protein OH344_03005 [Candidatus Parvarchaeota archaeon]|nr:hypothetical protein [Candidatus Jingweiarchaeum tengchongense]
MMDKFTISIILILLAEFFGFLIAKYSLSELKFLKKLKYERTIFILLNMVKSLYVLNPTILLASLISIFNILEGTLISSILLINKKKEILVLLEIFKLQMLFFVLVIIITVLI